MGLESFIYHGKALARVLGPGAVTIGAETYKSDLTRTYLLLTLLNSFPVVNGNGYTLLPPVLAKTTPTADNQPLNLDHQMEGNEPVYEGTDLVVGSMIKAYFATTGDIQMLPETSAPFKVIAVLWNRVSEAQKIINSIGDGEKQYGISFEILFDKTESGWVVFGADGPSYETEINEALLEAFQAKQYDKVALAVGGDGSGNSTHIWGGGFTLMPADKQAGIDAILTGSFKGQAALAAKVESKETVMPNMKEALAKLNTILAQSGFTVQVTGGDKLSLDLAGNKIDQPEDFYLSGWKRGDGTYTVNASLHILAGGIDGFKEDKRLEWAGGDGETMMTEVTPDTAKIKTPAEMKAVIEALNETVAGFEGFLSPADVQTKIDEAIAAATAGAAPVDKDLFTKEQMDEQVQTAVQTAMDAKAAIEATIKSRGEELVANGFVLTAERETSLAAFTVDATGDVAFKSWLTQLKANQKAMLEDVKKAGVEVTEPIKSALAHLDCKEDSGFTALMASCGQPEFSPSLEAGGGSPTEPAGAAGVC